MIELPADQIAALTALRHRLHRNPELSGVEAKTAALIASQLENPGPDRIWTGLGGHGVAAQFSGQSAGPTVLIRCELDALPIRETSDLPYRSATEAVAHLCGHDGHMAMVMGVAQALSCRPARGRVIVLFQPAEETGAGARAVVSDSQWPAIRPDFAFAIHNLPGWALGRVGVAPAAACCASRGMQIRLTGKASHAAAPDDGLSPAPAVARLIRDLPAIGPGGDLNEDFALATLTHARIGEPNFGIAPGDAELRVTLRSVSDRGMEAMMTDATRIVADAAGDLATETVWHEVFPATVNHPEAVAAVVQAARMQGLDLHQQGCLMRWSEDFAHFGLDGAKTALILLGSGENQPQLHNPDYDFPDALIAPGVGLFLRIVEQILGAGDKPGYR